jgi:hypothetical protein
MKIEESGSISKRHGSADPDPHKNVMDPQHCFFGFLWVIFALQDPDPDLDSGTPSNPDPIRIYNTVVEEYL